MRRAHTGSLLVLLVLVISTSGCITPPPTPQPTAVREKAERLAPVPEVVAQSAPSPTATTAKPPATAITEEPKAEGITENPPGDAEALEKKLLEIDPNNFDRSTVIDSSWFPLKPGTQFVYEGTTENGGEDGDEEIPHRSVFTVTDLTKVINGIRALVTLESDHSDGEMEALQLTYFAQDNNGNVWRLGQYRETYRHEKFIGGRVWFVGMPEGAKAGIVMPADPQLGMPSYSEGYAPSPFNWTVRGRVFQVGQRATVVADSYDDVLVIEETSDEETGSSQLKYYAPRVGIVRVGWSGADETKERLELVQHMQLNPEEMAAMRGEARELEGRAYMLCSTSPAEPLSP